LKRIEANGVSTIIVETASRFARDVMVQEVGHAMLRSRGIDLVAADDPRSFLDDRPTAKLVRQVLGAISEFDKAMTVAKLRGARERKRRQTGKCEGRKSHAERNPELVAMVKRLRRAKPKGGQRSLREIADVPAGSSECAGQTLRSGVDQVDASPGGSGEGIVKHLADNDADRGTVRRRDHLPTAL
jgi:DNA invertase Pin-like site-specific DNA recombinase